MGRGERPIRTPVRVIAIALAALLTAGCASAPKPPPPTGDAGSLLDSATTSTVEADVGSHRAESRSRGPRSQPGAASPYVRVDANFEYEEIPWKFRNAAGRRLSSTNYRLFTTGEKPWMHAYALHFAEESLKAYRALLADLPAPRRTLDIYLFAKRSEWQDHTRDLMGEHADLYLNLGRGGYSTRGTAVLYDIDFNDTFAILAHEGWHQYTQVTFRNALPTWLEEGIATYMEGWRQAPGRPARFRPWDNRQRYDALRHAWEHGRLIPLPQLVDRSPQFYLDDDSRGLLTYYAQVWVLVQFLVHGEEGRYREPLRRLLEDAAAGRMAVTILSSSSIPEIQKRRQLASSNYGPGALIAYFNRDWAGAFQQEFDAFIERILNDEEFLASLMQDDLARTGPFEPGEPASTTALPSNSNPD